MIPLYFCRQPAVPNPPNQIFLDLCSLSQKRQQNAVGVALQLCLAPAGVWGSAPRGVGKRRPPTPLQNNICSVSRTLAAYPEFLFLPSTWQLLSGNKFKLENEITKTQLEKYPQISPTFFFLLQRLMYEKKWLIQALLRRWSLRPNRVRAQSIFCKCFD